MRKTEQVETDRWTKKVGSRFNLPFSHQVFSTAIGSHFQPSSKEIASRTKGPDIFDCPAYSHRIKGVWWSDYLLEVDIVATEVASILFVVESCNSSLRGPGCADGSGTNAR